MHNKESQPQLAAGHSLSLKLGNENRSLLRSITPSLSNKKGDLAMTILVFVVLVAIGITLFGFLGFDSNVQSKIKNIKLPMKQAIYTEQYLVAQSEFIAGESIRKGGDVKANFIEIAKSKELGIESVGNYFGKIRNGEFEFGARDTESGYYLKFDTDVSISDSSQGQSDFENSAKNSQGHKNSTESFYGSAPLEVNGNDEVKYYLEIKELFVHAVSGMNEVERNFDIKIEFDKNGNVRKVYKD